MLNLSIWALTHRCTPTLTLSRHNVWPGAVTGWKRSPGVLMMWSQRWTSSFSRHVESRYGFSVSHQTAHILPVYMSDCIVSVCSFEVAEVLFLLDLKYCIYFKICHRVTNTAHKDPANQLANLFISNNLSDLRFVILPWLHDDILLRCPPPTLVFNLMFSLFFLKNEGTSPEARVSGWQHY